MSPRPRHVPLRRCAVCRASLTKADLVRLVSTDDGWRVDRDLAAGGRGTWVCRDCAARSGERDTRRAFGRAFRQQADDVAELLRSSGVVNERPGVRPDGAPAPSGRDA